MGEFNAIPLHKLLSDAAKRHGDEVVRLLGMNDADNMAMEASHSAMLTNLPWATNDEKANNLEKSALIALSLAKKLREK